jgi:hypothetical protein
MKKIKAFLKKAWEYIKKRKVLLILLFVVLVVVVNSLFYIFTGSSPFIPDSTGGLGIGQRPGGEFYEPGEGYEAESDQLIDNVPYDSVNFSVGSLQPDVDGKQIFIVGLKDEETRQLFNQWLEQYKYPEGTRVEFYIKPN